MKSQFIPKPSILNKFLSQFWFAPQDVLLRSTEAVILQTVSLPHPILDVGIGDASIADIFYPRSLVIDHGVDLDSDGINRAKSSKKYKKVSVANAEKLPFKSASFATVICNSTCEHITHDTKAISEMGRVLKKGGTLHLTVPSIYLPKMILEQERFEGNENPENALDKFNQRVAHKHYRSLESWKKILSQAKLNLVLSKYYFPEKTTQVWYSLMRFSISKFLGREMWSWIGHSRLTEFIPKQLTIWFLLNLKLRRAYDEAFLTSEDMGGMLYIQARKK